MLVAIVVTERLIVAKRDQMSQNTFIFHVVHLTLSSSEAAAEEDVGRSSNTTTWDSNTDHDDGPLCNDLNEICVP